MSASSRPFLLVAACVACCAYVAACTEPRQAAPPVQPATELAAQVLLSDSLVRGAVVTASIVVTGANADHIASFTARLDYDTAALKYLDDVVLEDGGTRASNPLAGRIRVAGMNAGAFRSGTLASFRFQVLDPAGAERSLALTMDELHAADRGNAMSSVRVIRPPVVAVKR